MTERVHIPCQADGCGATHLGLVWKPVMRSEADDWTVAQRLGLTNDARPDSDRPYAMVSPDDRPGALEMHYRDELEFL